MDKKLYLITTRDGKTKYVASLTDDEKSELVGKGASVEDPATGMNNTSSVLSEEEFKVTKGDLLNIVKALTTSVEDALRKNEDGVSYTRQFFNRKSNSVIIQVAFEQDKDNPGKPSEQRFEFKLANKKVALKQGNTYVDVAQLVQQSGTITINKDVATDVIYNVIKQQNNATGHAGEESKEGEQNTMGIQECNLEEFGNAVKNYRTKGKSKETIKELFKASRSFPGDDIQHKFANAAKAYRQQGCCNEGNDPELQRLEKAEKEARANYTQYPYDKSSQEEYSRASNALKSYCLKNGLEYYGKYPGTAKKRVTEEEGTTMEPQVNSPSDPRTCCEGSLNMDMSLFIRLLEFAREDAAEDKDLHFVAENLDQVCKNKGCATMDDYEQIISRSETKGGKNGSVVLGDKEQEMNEYQDPYLEKDSVSSLFGKLELAYDTVSGECSILDANYVESSGPVVFFDAIPTDYDIESDYIYNGDRQSEKTVVFHVTDADLNIIGGSRNGEEIGEVEASEMITPEDRQRVLEFALDNFEYLG